MGTQGISGWPRDRVIGAGLMPLRVLGFWEACSGHLESPVLLVLDWETLRFPLGHCRVPGAALSLAQVQRDDESLIEGHRTSSPCVEPKWARKSSVHPLDHSTKTVANNKLRRNLMSAPPVMRHSMTKESEEPEFLQVGARTDPGIHPYSLDQWPPVFRTSQTPLDTSACLMCM